MGVRQTLRLGTYAGIPIGMNWSVVVIFGLITWELADMVLPDYGGGTSSSYWVAAVAAAALFFFSLLAHEVAHAVVARRNGVGVHSITLWLFGGVAQLEGEALSPGADFRIAAVGPGTSIVLGALFGSLEVLAQRAGVQGLPVDVLKWLCYINILLAAFNLIPAAPLDGGRILRAGLWRRSGDQGRASVTASRAGRGFGIGLIAVGLVACVVGDAFGLWLAFMGWFLFSAARAEEGGARLRNGLVGRRVSDVMLHQPPALPAAMTVAEVWRGYVPWLRGEAVAVTGVSGWLEGVLTMDQLRSVPSDASASTRIGSIAIPMASVLVAYPDESMIDLLHRMQGHEGPAVVLDGEGRFIGLVTPMDVQRAAQQITAGGRPEFERPAIGSPTPR